MLKDWRRYWELARLQVGRVPVMGWVVAGLIAVSLGVVFYMELSGPAYVALYEGLSPADGGKVIAALQKLGISYQLQGAGNVILVPAPDLAEARLQLGAAEVPQGGSAAGWAKVEDAPMTASELAQDTMATQALEASLAQSIAGLAGVSSAQVYLALPPDTPFLADQPKPAASVVIAADESSAMAQGSVIANLVAGAVPGLAASAVNVETTAGLSVYPAGDKTGTAAQLATVQAVENGAAARVAVLLGALVGAGNFRTDVSADLDFTQEQVHQVAYGPAQLVAHQVSAQSSDMGSGPNIGIPGALSNQPPAVTTAATPGSGSGSGAGAGAAAAAPAAPQQSSKNLDQTYVTDESESEITRPDWVVKSVAVSVVLNKASLGVVTIGQVKAAVAGAFAYPQVSVSVLAAPFQASASGGMFPRVVLAEDMGALTRAGLQLMAAAALLYGLALPLGRRLSGVTVTPSVAAVAAPGRPQPLLVPPQDFSHIRERAAENITGVARLLQSWVEDDG